MWPDPQITADFVTLTENILNGKVHYLCSKCFCIPRHLGPFFDPFIPITDKKLKIPNKKSLQNHN